MKRSVYINFIIFFFLTSITWAQEPVWLSNQAPRKLKKKFKTSGMHRYCALRKKGDDKEGRNRHGSWGKGTDYVQWIRKGASIERAQYVCPCKNEDYSLVLKDPMGKDQKIELIQEDSVCYVKFKLNQEGRYNAYYITQTPSDDALNINVAKAELISHSCRNGHYKKIDNRPVKFYPEVTDFEIIRIRKSGETLHHFTTSGTDEAFQVLYKGKPLSGVPVKIYTQKGWVNTKKTDKDGKVHIDFIQDYFSKLQELDRRKVYYYMVEADYTANDSITYKGQTYPKIHYTATMSDGYRPWRLMYSSKVWGLIIFLAVFVITSIGVFVYKERRKRPYKEITFDESK